MTFPLRRALKLGAWALAVAVVAAYLSVAFVYHSFNVFTPPERIKSLGRTYLLSGTPPLTFEELRERREQRLPNFVKFNTFERAGTLLPGRSIYQWQSAATRGQATASAYLEWGARYISYGISGGP